jgi:hypothetical protein
MPTPPSYTNPWAYNWGAGYAYTGPPPTYHGIVAAAPTPNPMFNTAYPPQFEYNGQSYPPGSYAYQSYATLEATVAAVSTQDYQAVADNDNSQVEENNTDAQ